MTFSSRDRYQKGSDTDRHELTKSNLQIAPFVSFGKKSESAHGVVLRTLLANFLIGGSRELAVSRVAEYFAHELELSDDLSGRVPPGHARMTLRQTIERLSGKVTELETTDLIVQNLQRMHPDTSAAFDAFDSHPPKDSDAIDVCRRAVIIRRIRCVGD